MTVLAVVSLTAVGIAQRIPSAAAVVDGRERRGASEDSTPGLGAGPRSQAESLPPAAHARISAVIGEDQTAYHVVDQPHGFRMTNADRGVSADFTSEGVVFRGGVNQWAMRLRGYGYGESLREAAATRTVGALNRVEYRRGAVTEWYLNGPLGLEQGFTLERPPAEPNGQPLSLAFAMSGNLTASVDPGARSLTLRKDGSAALHYGGLIALDANGRELRAWLEVAGSELRLRVDDADARYPVTIDPYVEAPRLTTAMPCDPTGVCDDGTLDDRFGYSVSISADASTIVVGVPYKYSSNVQSGAAYVFLKPDDFLGGWNSFAPNHFKAKLLPSDPVTGGRNLGFAVDISHDGGTIVAAAPDLFNASPDPTGAAYVFVRPSGGWGTLPVQTQTAKLTPALQSNVDTGGFPESVAISGDGGTIAAGAPNFQMDSVYYGAAYLFLRPATGWVTSTETQRLIGPHESSYGLPVALSDDASTLAVGATYEDPLGGGPYSGAVHVLVRQDTPGSAPAYAAAATLASSSGITGDYLGWSLGVSGDGSAIVTGAPGPWGDPLAPLFGAVYVFVRPPAGWTTAGAPLTETARLTTSEGNGTDALGGSVDMSIDGSTIVATRKRRIIGPPVIPTPAYFFAKPAGGWVSATEDTRVESPDPADDWFGWSTSLSANGAVAVVGAPGTTIDFFPFHGAAYVFTGTAAAPRASISPASVTFDPQPLGTTSAPQAVTVTNTGSAPLHVASVGVTGPFTSTQNCVAASPIAPGSSCSESVAFAPLSVGPLTGTLTFTDDSGGTSGAVQEVALQGDGAKSDTSTTIVSVSPNPVFVGGSTLVSFDVSAEGGLSPSGTVTVQASTGESCTSGVVSNGCTLTFSTPGPRTITATYNGSASFNPSTSPGILVRAVDFSVSASPSSQSVSGRKAIYKLTVTGQGGLTGTVAMACAGGPPNSTCAVSPSSVNLSGSAASAKATLTLPAGAAAGTYTVTFTGSYHGVTRSTTASLRVK